MKDKPEPPEPPKFSAATILDRLKTMLAWVEQSERFAQALDWLGDAAKHPEGSEARALASLRDDVDFALSRLSWRADMAAYLRAHTTHCSDLLLHVMLARRGDGHDALQLMRRYHRLFGDERSADGTVTPETFPDSFAWDAYLRVSALPELAERYPDHLRHGARQMHGWPMIVSPHLDCLPEFRRLAERLGVGADYPLAITPRRKRGVETPLLRRLEPLVWRLHALRLFLADSEATRGQEDFAGRICGFWWDYPDERPGPEEVAVLRLVPSLPPLTQKSAREWSRRVIVPLLMLRDAGTAETCRVPALQNIWRHRSVKSRATFRSRLHSAVSDTLRRSARPG